MNNKNRFLIYTFLIFGVFLIGLNSCDKDEVSATAPILTTTNVTEITIATAACGGNISSAGGAIITARGVCWSNNQQPTINDSKTEDGNGEGSFTSILTDLIPETTYYVCAYATNSAGTGYGSIVSFTTPDGDSANSFTDPRDGNVYKTVTIGDQIWMAENLRYLPSVVGPSTRSSMTPYYYVYGYNGTDVTEAKATANYNTYGVIYNWSAAMAGSSSSAANPSGVQGVCPVGWHLPSDAEWTTLTTYLGGEDIAGGKLKETGTAHWISASTGTTNETNFTALPGGYLTNLDKFSHEGVYGIWWSSTEHSSTNVLHRSMICDDNKVFRNIFNSENGIYIRCVKD